MYKKRIIFILVFCSSTLLLPGVASAKDVSSFNPKIITEEHEGLPEGIPEPAILITEDQGIPEESAWTYRYLIPTSIALATIVILGNVIQYFRKVVKKRYKVVE